MYLCESGEGVTLSCLVERNKQKKNVHIRTSKCEHPSVAHSIFLFIIFAMFFFLEGTQVMCLLPIIIYTLVRVAEYVCPKRNRVRVVIYGCVDEVDLASARGACSGFYFSCTFRQRHLATILLYILPCFYSRPGVSTSRIFFFSSITIFIVYIYTIFFLFYAQTLEGDFG